MLLQKTQRFSSTTFRPVCCSSPGVTVWVCALPKAHTAVSHLFRWAAVPLLLLVILTAALLHRCCGWLPVMGALREIVPRLKPKECHMYLDGQQYICYVCVFLIPLRSRWRIFFCTLRTRQLVVLYCCTGCTRQRVGNRIYCTVVHTILILISHLLWASDLDLEYYWIWCFLRIVQMRRPNPIGLFNAT